MAGHCQAGGIQCKEMILFSEMLTVFLTALMICLLVQGFAWNLLSITRRVLGIFKIAMDIDPNGGRS